MSAPRLWIDGSAFCVNILRGGEDPWRDPGSLGLFLRECVSLLGLEIVDIDAAVSLKAWFAHSGSRPRTCRELEQALGDAAFAAHLKRGIETAQGALPGLPLALAWPGPGTLAARFLEDTPEEEDLDDLVVALAGLLREVYTPGPCLLRVEEQDPRALPLLPPLSNVAQHYGLAAALFLPGGAASAPAAEGFGLVYREGALAGGAAHGDNIILPPAYWEGAEQPLPRDACVFTAIPADMLPENVQARLDVLRRSCA